MVTRKDFVGGGAALFGAAFLPTAACAAEGDWKSAFRSVGFDPDAPDAAWFAVTSDIHADKQHISLAEHVATWNAMEPRPAFVAALGDMGQVNGCFGHRPSPQVAAENAERQFGAINAVLSQGLRKDIPRVYVVGNHDTYIGEDDRALWRTHFPDQPPYCAFDACGLRFVKWDGGVDGMIDAEQEKWIRNECATCPKDVQLVVLVHQPSVGSCGMERDIGRVAKAALAGRPGVTWLLGGHEHHNAFARWDLPGGGTLAVATHTMDRHGWWAYGVKAGRIVARLFKSNASDSFAGEKMPEAYASKGEIPLAWQGRNDVALALLCGYDPLQVPQGEGGADSHAVCDSRQAMRRAEDETSGTVLPFGGRRELGGNETFRRCARRERVPHSAGARGCGDAVGQVRGLWVRR